MQGLKIHFQNRPWYDGLSLSLMVKGGKKMSVAKKIVFEVVDEGEYIEPVLKITQDQAQEFIDQLWYCGLRPSEGSGSAGSLRATETHLNDMQKIAFNRLKID